MHNRWYLVKSVNSFICNLSWKNILDKINTVFENKKNIKKLYFQNLFYLT